MIYRCVCLFIALFALYVFLVCPAIPSRNVSFLCGKPIAHRGVFDNENVSENSLSAFFVAMEQELPIELDVRLTADGVPVVIHDDTLKRLCGVDARVSDLNADSLTEFPLAAGGESVPTLESVLDFVKGKVPLLIELKGEGGLPVAEKVAEVLKDYSGEYAVQSFNPYYLFRYRRISPDTPLGFLSNRRYGKGIYSKLFAFFSANLLFNFTFRPDFVSYRFSDRLPLSFKLCRRLGAKTLAWTVKDEGEYSSLKSFDGVIAENISERKRTP